MSGIAGIFHIEIAKPVDPARVRAMVAAQSPAGSDAVAWTAPGAGLGGTVPPLALAAHPFAVACDGLITNAAERRAELELLGHVFETNDDREVIVHGWRQWGDACVDRFDGAFALAVVDGRRQRLMLVRDRLGERPLHIARLADGSLVFSSRIKALLAHPLLRRELDPRAVDDYLAFGHVPDDASLIAGISRIPPGHRMIVERGRPVAPPSRWWTLDTSRRARGSAAALEAELASRLGSSIRARIPAQSVAGAMLGSGLETAALVALMADASSQAIHSVAIAQPGDRAVETMTRRFATRHRERKPSERNHTLADVLADATDEPMADPALLHAWRLHALAGEKLPAMLDASGGAEVFGLREQQASLAQQLLSRIRGGGEAGEADAFLRETLWLTAAQRARLLTPGNRGAGEGHRPEDRVAALFRDAPTRGRQGRMRLATLTLSLPGMIAGRDRIARALSLDVRRPMLDHHLVTFAAGLPPLPLMPHLTPAALLRRVTARALPIDAIDMGGGPPPEPLDAWFRGPLAADARKLTRGSALAETGLFDRAAIATIVTDHQAGARDHGRLLWQLLMLDKALARLFGLGRQSAG
jgi:asparagine synthase (glutamine-hydrolysing)